MSKKLFKHLEGNVFTLSEVKAWGSQFPLHFDYVLKDLIRDGYITEEDAARFRDRYIQNPDQYYNAFMTHYGPYAKVIYGPHSLQTPQLKQKVIEPFINLIKSIDV